MLKLSIFGLEDTHSSWLLFSFPRPQHALSIYLFLQEQMLFVVLHLAQGKMEFRNQNLEREASHMMFLKFLCAPHNITVFSKSLLSSFFFPSH